MSRVEGELPMIEQHGIRCYKCSEEIYSEGVQVTSDRPPSPPPTRDVPGKAHILPRPQQPAPRPIPPPPPAAPPPPRGTRTRHDFVFCRCGEVYVDGGFDYQRVGATNLSRIENVSRSVDRKNLPFYFRKEQE